MTTTESPLSQATDDRLDSMLFQGEEVEEELTMEGARLAVTTHRVLVFTPDGDANGRLFDHEDRPNVLDANVQTSGRDAYAGWGVKSAVYGVVFLGGGFVVQSSGILNTLGEIKTPESGPGAGIAQFAATLPTVFTVLITGLLLVGGLLLLVAAGLGAFYYTSRSDELVIERAGRDPIRVPMQEGEEGEQIARRLRTVVGTGSKPSTD
ncbi:hypothetical protein [Halorussus halophilus]|uniref:hypothetical protein n=1 Tax=Halorussus halophilus TaxID=2650975 RepID=UPI001CE49B1E|nr:hypothetical protein [Halorussus halophilus]